MSGGLGAVALRGTSWAVLARLGRTVVGIGTLTVLSRILSPADFGIAALVVFVTGFATMFADFGTRMALVQRKEITELDANSVYWSNVLFSVAVAVALYVFAPQVATLLGTAELADALRWVSPVFVLGGLQSVPLSMLERKMGFRVIALSEFLAAVCGAATAIVMALNGFRVGALVGQQLAMTTVVTVLVIYFARWRPQLQFSYAAFRSLFGYGAYVTGANMVQFLSNQIDRPIVGRFLSPQDLGFVAMNRQIVATPLTIVVQMARKVLFPIMSKIQDDDVRLSRGVLEVQYGLALVMAPICLGLWVLAGPIVEVLLGAGWEMVAVILGFTTIRSFFSIFPDVNAVLFSAKGQAKFQFHWSIFSLIVNTVVLLIAVPYGLVALMAARLGISLVLGVLNSWFAVRLVGMSLLDKFMVALRPFCSAVLMAALVYVCDIWLLGLESIWSLPVLRIVIGVALGVVSYVAFELLIDGKKFRATAGKVRQAMSSRK